MVRPEASWTGLICRIKTISDCQSPSSQIPRVQPEAGIDGYGEKDWEKEVLKTTVENSMRIFV